MNPAETIATWTTQRRIATIMVMLVLTVAIGYGAVGLEQETDLGQFETDSIEAEKLEYINDNFGDTESEQTTSVQIIIQGENVLDRESLLATIELQQDFLDDSVVDDTLVDAPFTDISSVIATTLAQQANPDDPDQLDLTLEEQYAIIANADQAHLDAAVQTLLGEDGPNGLLSLMPTDYEPGTTESDARILVVTQNVDDALGVEGNAPEAIVDSQLQMDELVDDRFGDDGFVFGQGIITDELNRSLSDSLVLVIPFALLFVIGTLLLAYRDILDIILGVVGILVVLIWTFGFMGWANVNFNQIFIAVPVLLIGLSIDYAIHVFMRQREHREQDDSLDSESAMRSALAGLLVALTWVTATAVFGFLSNLVSPVAPIRDFGIVSAFGIVAALLIFGLLIPASKVTLDHLFEGYGIDRRKRAFGTGGGMFTRALSSGHTLAKRAPVIVLVVALLLTVGGAYAASDIDTSFEVEDFIADEPAEWTQQLPEMIRPGEYSTKANLEVLDDRFLREDQQASILVEGAVDSDNALERVEQASSTAGEQSVTLKLAGDQPAVTSPLTEMQSLARQSDQFAQIFNGADTDNDGIPDSNLGAVYDAFFEAAPDRAKQVFARTDDGSYEAMLITVSLHGDASTDDITTQMRTVASSIDGNGFESTATGQVVVFSIIEDELFQTVFESLLISLAAVFLFLMLVYRITDGSATLGIVTLAPIALAVAWILGTMYLIGMPFNVVTGTITSLTIGLGVAYNIHMSERFRLELSRGHDVMDALYLSVTGTGGALLGSAATTAGGFGVLVLAIIPILQMFGTITALTIIYAFLGSVLVLPSLLVLWLKYLGPDDYGTDDTATTER